MDPDFWLRMWQGTDTPGFHTPEPNRLLVHNLPALALPDGARLFLPLCGRTRDIGWLLDRGHKVAGAELSPIAVQLLFEDLGLTPEVTEAGPLTRLSAGNLVIFQGDVFDLTAADLGPVAAIYDRAALIALPPDLRRRYADHLVELSGRAPQLLLSFDPVRPRLQGPPFPISADEIAALYGSRYRGTPLARLAFYDPGGGLPVEYDTAWLLD
jgi:thiopurine S-methyltransferase